MKYKYIFGPVPSRRLGISLGVDLLPRKTCSFNCIYCECGITSNLTVERKIWVDTSGVIEEINHFLSSDSGKTIDFITFSGSGEPTLAMNIGEIIKYIKSRYNAQVCVITNSSLLWNEEVQNDIINADLVIPSLDAVSPDVFFNIDRNHSDITIENILNGLIQFRKKYKNKLYLEILLVKNINDGKQELVKLAEAAKKIQPDRIQINTCVRQGTEKNLERLSGEELQAAAAYFSGFEVEIAGNYQPQKKIKINAGPIINMLKRRMCSAADLAAMIGITEGELEHYFLSVTNSDFKIIKENINKIDYYKLVDLKNTTIC